MAVVWIDGPDAEHFLQGLLSHDVAGLEVGSDLAALLLDGKGHIRAGLIVHRDGPAAFTMLADDATAEATTAVLHEYHFSEDLEITGPERSDAALLTGEAAAPEGAELVVGGWIPGSRIALIPQPLPATDGDAALAEILRIEAGIPRVGIDTNDTSLPHETGLVGRTVSFEKGCYLGQETVARVEYRGGVRRHLRGVSTAELLPVGTQLRAGDSVIATLTSTALSPRHGPIGLAVVRDDQADGDVTAGGEPAAIRELPFPAG